MAILDVKKILLVTTEGVDSKGAEDTARALAERFGASVLIADSIRTPFHLPESPVPDTSKIIEIARGVKQAYLDNVAKPFDAQGIPVETRILTSVRTSQDISKLAAAESCDLVIRYAKGEYSKLPGRFGQTARNLMRLCAKPLLFVSETLPADPCVLACINAEHSADENAAIVQAAKQMVVSPTQLHGLTCWQFNPSWFLAEDADQPANDISSEEREEIFDRIRADLGTQFDLALFDDRFLIEQGEPTSLIPVECDRKHADVCVMSSVSLNHPLGLQLGSSIEATIDRLSCSLLVVKPYGWTEP